MTGHLGFSYIGLIFLILLFGQEESRRDILLRTKTKYCWFLKEQENF